SSQAQVLSVEHLLRILDLVGKAVTDMRLTPNGRLLLEVALVRAAAPETDPSALGLQGRIERLERRMGFAEEGGQVVQPAQPQPRPAQPAPKPQRRQTPTGPKRPASSGSPAQAANPAPAPTIQPAKEAPAAQAAPAQAAPPQAQPAQPQAAAPGGLGLAQIKDSWQATLAEVGRASKRIQALLNPSRPLSYDDDHLVVEVQSSFHETTMSEEPNQQILGTALFNTLGIRPSIGFIARGSQASPGSQPAVSSVPTAPVQDVVEETAIEETEIAQGSAHDPVELIKEGLGAEVIEERTGQ
ncbi:MAG: hypothetical protein ACLGHL_03825, partial [Actinomycetota bacterium]